jgi:hypothetical protein
VESKEEKKTPVPPSTRNLRLFGAEFERGTSNGYAFVPLPDQHTKLTPGSQLPIVVATDESIKLRNAMRNLFGDKEYRFRLATSVVMSANGAGHVNASIATNIINSIGDFTALTTLFSEFFVQSMSIYWSPVSMFNGPEGYLPATTVSSVALGVAPLYHAQSTPSSLTNLVQIPETKFTNSNVMWSAVWHNNESRKPGIMVTSSGSAPTQSWAQVADAASYQGSILIMSDTNAALPISAQLGNFMVVYDAYFRVRQ